MRMARMAVVRVHEGQGTHIEPPLDPTWNKLTQLRWKAAVIEADTGLVVTVDEHPSNYSLQFKARERTSSVSTGGFNETWTMLTGISLGAEFQRQRERQP